MKWSVLVLCALGVVGEGTSGSTGATSGTTRARNRRSTFLNIVGKKPSSEDSYNAPLLPVELPLRLGGYGGVNLPILVLPVPVFTKSSDTCEVHNNKEVPVENPNKVPHTPRHRNLPYVESRPQFTQAPSVPNPTYSQTRPQEPIPHYTEPQPPEPVQKYVSPTIETPQRLPQPLPSQSNYNVKLGAGAKAHYKESTTQHANVPIYQPAQDPQPTVRYPEPVNTFTNPEVDEPVGSIPVYQPSYTPKPTVSNDVEPAPREQPIPYSEGRDQLFATSDELIQSYRRQKRGSPGSPAAFPVGRQLPARLPTAEPDMPLESTVPGPAPPLPNFHRSLRLQIDLTVPRAGYTEAFDVEWHAESNTARTVVEDGSTVIYRVPLLDGRVQFLEVEIDRTNGSAVRRCTMSPMLPTSAANRGFPGLPDMDKFHFVGYTSAEGRSDVERWHNFVIGKPGEGGAAPGESLNFTHQMLIFRDGEDAVPLKYTVITSSSVLGPAIDGYTHRYLLLPAPTAPILPDTQECDILEQLQHRQRRQIQDFVSGLADLATTTWNSRFNPLQGFLGPMKDANHDGEFDNYKNNFRRSYRDEKEQSVRKAQFIDTSRFVAAANRVASSFKTGINFMADRVVDEINFLFGVAPPPEETPPGLIPPDLSYSKLRAIAKELPENYDKWREQHGVSEVQHQGNCNSCWAFAITGSTEGALFKKTKKLVPLSPQSLVDCGAVYKTNGCDESWPEYGYSYIQERGLPSWEDYVYKSEVQECKKVQPVTRIRGYKNVTSLAGIKVAIYKYAPTVVIMGAKIDSFLNYIGGIYSDQLCAGLHHAVLAVGWGPEHLIIKNSWGPSWGEQGYIRMNPEVCSVTERASHAVVDKANIVREDLRASAKDEED